MFAAQILPKTAWIFFITTTLLVSGCGDGGGSGNGDSPQGQSYVDWNSIPEKFNPETEEFALEIDGIKAIDVRLFGFDSDFRVRYTKDLSNEFAVIKLYTVRSKNSKTYLSGIDLSSQASTLKVSKYGSYDCSLEISNQRLTQLKGACYLRIEMILPVGSEVEVYNVGRLKTKRFHAMENATLLESVGRAFSTDDKLKVIDDYLSSYRATKRTPSLSTVELEVLIKEFSWKEEKLTVLRKLHRYVSDRERLGDMIDNCFSYFDRDEARKVVGLN